MTVDPQTRPGFAIGRTSYLFRLRIIEVIREVGSPLNPEEAWILMVLDDAGGAAGTGDLKDAMMRDASTLTRQLDMLTRKEMIDRNKDDRDARIINVSLTKTGRKELKRLMPGFRTLREGAVKGVSKENYRIMIEALMRIQENLR